MSEGVSEFIGAHEMNKSRTLYSCIYNYPKLLNKFMKLERISNYAKIRKFE